MREILEKPSFSDTPGNGSSCRRSVSQIGGFETTPVVRRPPLLTETKQAVAAYLSVYNSRARDTNMGVAERFKAANL
jgi:hypothetical protein